MVVDGLDLFFNDVTEVGGSMCVCRAPRSLRVLEAQRLCASSFGAEVTQESQATATARVIAERYEVGNVAMARVYRVPSEFKPMLSLHLTGSHSHLLIVNGH